MPRGTFRHVASSYVMFSRRDHSVMIAIFPAIVDASWAHPASQNTRSMSRSNARSRNGLEFPIPTPEKLLSWGKRRHRFFDLVEKLPTRELKLQYLSRAYTAEVLRKISVTLPAPTPAAEHSGSEEHTEVSSESRSASEKDEEQDQLTESIRLEPFGQFSAAVSCRPLLDLLARDLNGPRGRPVPLSEQGEPADLVSLLACIELIVQQARSRQLFRSIRLDECRQRENAELFFERASAELERAVYQASLRPSRQSIRTLADRLHNSIGIVTDLEFVDALMQPDRLRAVYSENREKLLAYYIETLRTA